MIKVLVDWGADLEARTTSLQLGGRPFIKLTPLHLAACWGNIDMNAMLLKGANINAEDGSGCTPLRLLCESSTFDDPMYVEAADFLLRRGADETIGDDDDRLAIDLLGDDSRASRLGLLLANAPADRTWRRRGMLVMCRGFREKIPSKGERGRAVARARTGSGRGRGVAVRVLGTRGVVCWCA